MWLDCMKSYPNYISMINPPKNWSSPHDLPMIPSIFQAHLQLGARSSQQAAGQLQFSEQMQMQRTGHFFRHAILLKMLGKCWGNSENFWGMFLTSPEMCRNHQSCCDPNMEIAEITRETVIKCWKDVERC